MRTMLQLTMCFLFAMQNVASAENDCGNTSYSGPNGVVTSPDLPLPTPQNLSCTYSIDVGRNNSVLLKFLDFNLESPIYADFCIQDWLTITCNETDDENLDFTKRSCGTTVPGTPLWFFNCPVVTLKFFADSSVSGGGFSIEYKVFENADLKDYIYELNCGDTLYNNSSGFIRLPSNPTEYSARVNCTYTIISTNQTSVFSLGVTSFQQPQLIDSFADCNRDVIMIGCVSDGETELNPNRSQTFCRRSFDVQPSRVVLSNCSMVKISFRSSDYNYRGDGSIPFAVHPYDEDCGSALLFTGPTGIVTSPRLPLTYPHSLDCVYFFDVDRTTSVKLTFLSLKLDGTSRLPWADVCTDSWLTFNCSSHRDATPAIQNQKRKYCGETLTPLTLNYSNCDSLSLNFAIANSSDNTRGFQLRYIIESTGNTSTSTPDKDRVNTTLTGRSGFITSPQFPLHYPNNVDYVYSFDVNRSSSVGIYFHTFDIEGTSHSSSYYSDSCYFDWLTISCLPDNWYSQYRKVCGKRTTHLIQSYFNCDSLTINFVSDSSVTSKGFKIWYSITSTAAARGQSDCGNTSFYGPSGVISSPKFPLLYPINLTCIYSIDAGRNSSVQLKFKHFALEVPNSADYCVSDWLMITCNGTTHPNPNNKKKYCESIQWTSSMQFFDCSSLQIEFVTNDFTWFTETGVEGFMIEYTVTANPNAMDDNSELDCGTTMFTESTGVIQLPRNPTNFLATVNCTYTIWTNRTDAVWLNVSSNPILTQLLQSFQDCHKESLTIGCVSGEVNPNTTRVFCRKLSRYSSLGHIAFSGCGAVKLSIRSDTYDYRETFLIPFKVYGPNDFCGDTSFSAPTGNVSNVRFPFQLSRPINCMYTIDSGHVNAVAISIDRLHFRYDWYHTNVPCATGWLTITCLVNGTSVPHPLADKKICTFTYYDQNLMTARFPACRSVLLNYFVTSMSSDQGFSLRYRMGDYQLDCGETLFTNSSGVISLPRNPTNYPATINCTYTISTVHLRHIWLNANSDSASQLMQSFRDCSKEWMVVGCVSEGETDVNPSTSKIFCRRGESHFYGHLVYADCRTLKLSIRSYTYDNRETFYIPFFVIGPDNLCGNTSFSNSTGVISSPKLPFQYLKRVNCLYTIDNGSLNSFVLSLDRLKLPGSSELCDYGWLTITCLVNGTSMAQPLSERKFCGVRYSPTAEGFPTCNSVLLNFSTSYISSEPQFTMRYKWGDYEIDCGTTLFTNTSGVIKLPRNPTAYPATVNCTYTISTTGLSHIWLNAYFYYVNHILQFFQECDGAGVTIGCLAEGETELNPNTTMVFCRNRQMPYSSEPRLVFIDCRALKLSIRSMAYDYREMMSLAFNVFEPDKICGNTSYSAPYGIVSSPRLPKSYPKAVSCLYVIESDHVNSVVLKVDRLNFGSRYGGNQPCNDSWLMITCLVNGTSVVHPFADRKLCRIYSPIVETFPACRSVLLNFSIGYTNHEDTGFTVRYTTGDYDPDCGNTSFSGPTGVITSPPRPQTYQSHNLNCLYSITGAQNTTISLSFISFRLSGQSQVPVDYCYSDWLKVGCLSDRSAAANISSSRRYCGYKTTPLKFAFPNCEVVVLNYGSNSQWSRGEFKAIYTVIETESLCGAPLYGPPSGVISFRLNHTDSGDSFDCKYVINATKPSSISLTIWSISLQSSVGRNCERDWLSVKGIDGQIVSKHNISHRSCDHLNSSIQLIFSGCTTIEVDFHRDSEDTGKTFRIEYTIASYGDNIPTDELTSVSTAIPVTANCEVGCEINKDGTSCDCPTTQSGDVVANTQMNSSGQRGHAVGISLGVVLVAAGAICLGAFLLFRRRQKKNRSEMLVQETEEERAQRELDAESKKSESGDYRKQDRDTSKYLPLRPISQVGFEEPSSSTNSTQNLSEFQPGL